MCQKDGLEFFLPFSIGTLITMGPTEKNPPSQRFKKITTLMISVKKVVMFCPKKATLSSKVPEQNLFFFLEIGSYFFLYTLSDNFNYG